MENDPCRMLYQFYKNLCHNCVLQVVCFYSVKCEGYLKLQVKLIWFISIIQIILTMFGRFHKALFVLGMFLWYSYEGRLFFCSYIGYAFILRAKKWISFWQGENASHIVFLCFSLINLFCCNFVRTFFVCMVKQVLNVSFVQVMDQFQIQFCMIV